MGMSEIEIDMVAETLVTEYDLQLEEAEEIVKSYLKDNDTEDFDSLTINEVAHAVYLFSKE
jgi:hypothetical protein